MTEPRVQDRPKVALSRRRFLQASGATAGVVGVASQTNLMTFDKVHAQPAVAPTAAGAQTTVTKSFCHQCPARCGIDVYTTNGRVHAIYGTVDNPISNGKLCPKGHYGQYLLYYPDRFKSPMKRTNPKKGRDEDPRFVPITWDEALKTVADRLNALRDKGESHRFGLLFGRGWGATDAGLFGDFSKLYGSPNIGLNHSSMCSDASKKAKLCADGNYSYNSYDYANTNYLLIFGAGFLEAFRPLNNNLQVWGHMRTKAPRTKVTVVDVHTSTTGAAADRLLLTKSGTDGALALAMAHVIVSEGLWDRKFVGDFIDGINRFKPGAAVATTYSQEDLERRREAAAKAAAKKAESDKKAIAERAKLHSDIDALRVKIEETDDEKLIAEFNTKIGELQKKEADAERLASEIKAQRSVAKRRRRSPRSASRCSKKSGRSVCSSGGTRCSRTARRNGPRRSRRSRPRTSARWLSTSVRPARPSPCSSVARRRTPTVSTTAWPSTPSTPWWAPSSPRAAWVISPAFPGASCR